MSPLVGSVSWYSTCGCIYVLLGGCSIILDSDRVQCVDDTDCVMRGTALTDGVCLESVCVPKQQTWECEHGAARTGDPTSPFNVTLHMRDIVSNEPLAGVSSRLCRKLDVHCEEPASAGVTSDARGAVSLRVMPGFIGYVELTRKDIGTGLYFFNPPIDRDEDLGTIELVSPPIATALAAQTAAPLSPDRGLLVLRSLDCQGNPTPGISYAMDDPDEMRSTYYSVDGLPTTAATGTDRDGYGGFVNVAPGIVAVTAHDATEQPTSTTVSVLIRAGSVTYSRVLRPESSSEQAESPNAS